MDSFKSIFQHELPSKIVQKIKETIYIKKTQLVQKGTLLIARKNNQNAQKRCTMILTTSHLYYAESDIEAADDKICIKSKAKIHISWLRSIFYSKKDYTTGKSQFFFELVKGKKSVVFSSSNFEEFNHWVMNISYLTVQTNFIKKYELESEIGHGGSARVYRIIDTNTGTAYACKKFYKESLYYGTEFKDLLKEITILRTLKGHPNIVDLIEIQETENSIYIITELLEGGRVTVRGERYTINDIKAIAGAVLSALVYMNGHDIVHRDLKPGNILLQYKDKPVAENVIKVIDFGIATFYKDNEQRYKNCGTVGYLAPENIARSKDIVINPISDVFTLGIILYNALTGTRLFIKSDERSTINANKKAYINFSHHTIRDIPLPCKFISKNFVKGNA